MPFGEYELSPSLIGLSLLHTPHPEVRREIWFALRAVQDEIFAMLVRRRIELIHSKSA